MQPFFYSHAHFPRAQTSVKPPLRRGARKQCTVRTHRSPIAAAAGWALGWLAAEFRTSAMRRPLSALGSAGHCPNAEDSAAGCPLDRNHEGASPTPCPALRGSAVGPQGNEAPASSDLRRQKAQGMGRRAPPPGNGPAYGDVLLLVRLRHAQALQLRSNLCRFRQ